MTYTKEQATEVRDAIQKMVDDGVSFKVGTAHFIKTTGGYMAYDYGGDDEVKPDVVITGEVFRVTADKPWSYEDPEGYYVQVQFRNSGWVHVKSGNVIPYKGFGLIA